MRRFLAIFTAMAIAFVATGQELTVKDFYIDPSDISAVRYEVKDLNGEMCALVKIGLVLQNVTFEGSVVKSEFKDGEWWVYMVDKSWWLNIKTTKYLPLRYEFKEPLRKKSTYIMQVEIPKVAYTGPTGKMRIKSNVRDAEVYVDGEKLSSILPFEYEGPEGSHILEIKAPGYNTERMDFEIALRRTGTLSVWLKAEGSFQYKGISYEMKDIPGGVFQMGSSEKRSKESTMSYESPVHTVSLKPYKIGVTEVSQALWKAVMGSNPSLNQGDDLPVENVTWYDVQEFIAKLNAESGMHFRLPTEAEWEYAARAGGSSDEPAGGGSAEVAVFGVSTSCLCTKKPNAYGLYDMSGNVAEWCFDYLARYKADAVVNPTGPEKGIQKIVRGGSFADDPWMHRCAVRGHMKPADSNGKVGFRLALD
mgnify:CR=1 FL=1